MIEFLSKIPLLISVGCAALFVSALYFTIRLFLNARSVSADMGQFAATIRRATVTDEKVRRCGLSLEGIEKLRIASEELPSIPRRWWERIESDVEGYTSPEDVEGWFLTDRTERILPFEHVVGHRLHTRLFTSVPGLLTGSGLTLTFVAILWALHSVSYNKSNPVEPITGFEDLINGLSGKFLSSIVALLLSIAFTLFEKRVFRKLHLMHVDMLQAVDSAVPHLASSRILLDIQRFAAKQTVSVSNISSEVVDRFLAGFNQQVVPDLAHSMSSGVAERMQNEFRPTMDRMTDTLQELRVAIVGLESEKQDSITGEIRGLVTSLESSLVQALGKMGQDFHSALTSAATQEFGNIQGALEATRQMLSDMNTQFGSMQTAFAAIIERAEKSTEDQLKVGKEQTGALTSLMNGLMFKLQESADQNLTAVRSQLTAVVSDLSERVGSLSKDMMAAAENVAKQSQASASHVIEQTGNWSEATAKGLEALLSNIEARGRDFQEASKGLLDARTFVTELLSQNGTALQRMSEASRQVQSYTSALAAQTDALKSVSGGYSGVANQLREVSGNVKAGFEQHERMLGEYRRVFQDYKSVVDTLDTNLGKIISTLGSGLRDYNQSMENNFRAVVKISNEMIPEISSLLKTQVDELSEQFEELGTVISGSMERMNGRPK